MIRGTLVAVGGGSLAVRQRDGVHRYPLASGVQVFRDKLGSSIEALRPGDTVSATIDASRRATAIRARSVSGSASALPPPEGGNGDNPGASGTGTPGAGALYRGTALSSGGGALRVRQPNGARSFALAQGVVVFRNGRQSSLAQILPGDTLTLATDAAGAVTRIDASGPLSAGATATVAGALSATPAAAAPTVYRAGWRVPRHRGIGTRRGHLGARGGDGTHLQPLAGRAGQPRWRAVHPGPHPAGRHGDGHHGRQRAGHPHRGPQCRRPRRRQRPHRPHAAGVLALLGALLLLAVLLARRRQSPAPDPARRW